MGTAKTGAGSMSLRWSSSDPDHNCTGMSRNDSGILSVVHRHDDGGWWWYDETWTDEFGPFDTEAEADANVKKYVKECL